MPGVAAHSGDGTFPNIPFKVFNDFVKENFSSRITLSQALLVLFTVTENTDLLSLHARQQHGVYEGEIGQKSTGWIRSLARALNDKMDSEATYLFKTGTIRSNPKDTITDIGAKLDGMAKILKLDPFDEEGVFQGKLKTVSYKSIEAAQVICPIAVVCETITCLPRALLQSTKTRDIPRVALIKGSAIHDNVQLVTGRCPQCKTIYVADRERVVGADDTAAAVRVYLNDAKYLQAGKNLWVDRIFSGAILNAMYSFHASAAAYTEFWNNSFWSIHPQRTRKISRRQVWKVFVEESLRMVAGKSGLTLELPDKIHINEVAKGAFSALGENGIIRASDQHACNECTQKYRSTPDVIVTSDPGALLGEEAAHTVPGLPAEDNSMNVDHAPVNMAVVDGIVLGPKVCFFCLHPYGFRFLTATPSIVHMRNVQESL